MNSDFDTSGVRGAWIARTASESALDGSPGTNSISAMKRAAGILLLILWALPCEAQVNLSTVVAFDDAYSSLGESGNPATFYQASGVTFSGNYLGIVGGKGNGDPGNWDLFGTNGTAFLGNNSGAGSSITINLASAVNFISFDVGVAFGWQISFSAIDYLSGSQVSTFSFSMTDTSGGNEIGTWQTVTFSGAATFNKVTLQMLSSNNGGFAYGVDNIRFTPVPEPALYATTVGFTALGIAGYFRRQRRATEK